MNILPINLCGQPALNPAKSSQFDLHHAAPLIAFPYICSRIVNIVFLNSVNKISLITCSHRLGRKSVLESF